MRVALQNQRDTLLAFAGVLDGKLADIARVHAITELLVREACVLHRLPTTSPAYWLGWNRLRAQTGGKFHALIAAVSRAMAHTSRSSSLVETLKPPPAQHTLPTEIRPSQAGGFRAPYVTQKGRSLNHAAISVTAQVSAAAIRPA